MMRMRTTSARRTTTRTTSNPEPAPVWISVERSLAPRRVRPQREGVAMRLPSPDKNALLIAGVYLGVSSLWILGSDALVESLAGDDVAVLQRMQLVKGIGFMVATAIGLYLLVASSLARQRRQAEELRRMEEMLSVSQRLEALGTLAATVVHDFNNVITVIRGMTELAALDGCAPERMPSRMKEIERAADQAGGIVRQLSAFMHNAPQSFAPGDVAVVVQDFEPMLRHALGRRVALQLDLAAEPRPAVDHDRRKVEQILLNLAVNARDAMEEIETAELRIGVAVRTLRGHRSRFRTEPTDGTFVIVSMTDRGCGIPEAHLEAIFSPFFTTKPEGKGTGLGLASVLRLMRQHRGWVEVESRPGQGTRFDLFFPGVAPGGMVG